MDWIMATSHPFQQSNLTPPLLWWVWSCTRDFKLGHHIFANCCAREVPGWAGPLWLVNGWMTESSLPIDFQHVNVDSAGLGFCWMWALLLDIVTAWVLSQFFPSRVTQIPKMLPDIPTAWVLWSVQSPLW